MNPTAIRPLRLLDEDWSGLRHSAASRTALERLAAAEPLVARLGCRDLGDLVGLLRATARRDRPARSPSEEGPGERARDSGPELPAAVIRAMLHSARVDALVPRAIVQALAPGLVSVARRLNWGAGGEWTDGGAFLADAFATAWELVSEWSGDDRQYAVLDVLSAVRCRLRRRLLQHRRHLDHVRSDLLDAESRFGRCASASTDLDQLAGALDAARGRELDHPDAAVLYAHRVLGYSLSELSTLTGRSRRYLGARRDRAAQTLTA
ncbi:MAG: hypothetical protein ACRDWE_08240 [Acidimicrobiales bacterium]